jgi:hypothetical protein
MTRREVITKAITKQPSWVQAAETLRISARHARRLRRKLERWGMSAVMDQRGGRWPAEKLGKNRTRSKPPV